MPLTSSQRRSLIARMLSISALCLTSGLSAAAEDPSPKKTDAEIVADLKDFMQFQTEQDAFSGAVLLAKGDKILFENAYGFANHAFNAPNKVDTKFNLASMGKMFTAVAILQLVDQGKLSVDDKLIKVLPDYPDQDIAQKVTIYQLLTHTAGFGNMFNERFENTPKPKLDNLQALLALFAGKPLESEPGTRWSYSNSGFVVLGLVVEKLSGQSYYDYVRDHIFKPAGMNNTDNYRPHDDVPNLALGYTRGRLMGPRPPGPADKSTPRYINSDFLHRGSPAGGGYSTVEDLLRFSQALLGNKLLSKESTQLMSTGKFATGRGPEKYGFGMTEAFFDGVRIIGHTGGSEGVSTELDIYPQLGYTLVVLSNYDGGARAPVDRIKSLLTGHQGGPR